MPYLFTDLFNSCFKMGYFPDKWKIGVVCLIPKNNSTSVTAKSYRLITLIKTTAKAFEKLINGRLVYDLHSNYKLSDKQSINYLRLVSPWVPNLHFNFQNSLSS